MRILVVEDVDDQARWLIEKLSRILPDATFRHIRTESQFQHEFEELCSAPPDLVLMDVMLRWADPSPDMSVPPREYGGFARAGLRCVRALRENASTRNVKIIVNTVLEDIDFEVGELPGDIVLITKESDPTYLLDEIRRMTDHH